MVVVVVPALYTYINRNKRAFMNHTLLLNSAILNNNNSKIKSKTISVKFR